MMIATPLAFVLALTLQSNPQSPDPVDVVRELMVAQAAGDTARARALFADPENAFTLAELRRMHLRCTQLVASTITVTAQTEGEATVEESHTIALSTAKSVPSLIPSHSRIVLERTPGGWRIVKRSLLEKELLDRWVEAPNSEARAAVLAASPELLNATFVSAADVTVRRLANQSRREDSLALANLTTEIAASLGDPRAVAEAAAARAIAVRMQLARHADVVMQVSSESVSLADATGDPDLIARALMRHARAAEDTTARLDQASLERAVRLGEQLEDLATAAHVTVQYARALESEGRTRESFRYASLAAQYAEKANEPAADVSAGLLLGGAYLRNGDPKLAIRHFQRAAETARRAGFSAVEAFAYSSLINAYGAMGDEEAVKRIAEEGTQRFPGVDGLSILQNRFALLIADGRIDEAEQIFQQMKSLSASSGENARLMAALQMRLQEERGDYEGVLNVAKAALGGEYRWYEDAPVWYARVLNCVGRSDEAIVILEQIVNARRDADQSSLMGSPEFELVLGRGEAAEETLVSILVEHGHIARAFEIADVAKAGRVRQLMDDTQIRSGVRVADQEREQQLEARLANLNRALVARRYTEEEAAALLLDIEEARADLRDFRQQLRALEPAVAAQYARFGMNDLPPRLDGVAIVTYLQTKVQTFIFAAEPKVDGRRNITVRIVPQSLDALGQKVTRFIELVEQRNLRANAAAAELYDLLVKPVESSLRTAESICVIPDRRLWGIPFHALRDGKGQFLLDEAPVFYAPSIAALAAAELHRQPRKPHTKPSLLAFANPSVSSETASAYRVFSPTSELGPIPEAETEVRSIASIYGKDASRVYVAAEARESAFKENADSFDVLHIASHGLVQDNAPMYSSILFAAPRKEEQDDGLLEVREILGMRLHADLAVLSACDTGRASNVVGRGVVGMSWSFLAAGCPTTVVSLWSAQSAATSELMIEFHRGLHAGLSKPAALRAAQLRLRRNPRYRHMFYWAAFASIGAP